ncbi:hypothetical protein [Reyranella sp.]|uniref:hypothetical protein n=1 Tax=Reyranella sp. TaxID=1929291 RepID=UPI003BAD288F
MPVASGDEVLRFAQDDRSLEQAYAYATGYMSGALQREAAQAGIEAFTGKKPKPDWTGR